MTTTLAGFSTPLGALAPSTFTPGVDQYADVLDYINNGGNGNLQQQPNPPYWYDDPYSWDTFVIAGNTLPGIAVVTGTRTRHIDSKKSPGDHGATLTVQGWDPCKITVKLKIWTRAQDLELMRILASLVLPKPTTQTTKNTTTENGVTTTTLSTVTVPTAAPMTPYDCQHPQLVVLGVGSLLLENMSALVDVQPIGTKEITFNFIEYYPVTTKKFSVTTPTSAAPAAAVPGAGAQPVIPQAPPTQPPVSPADDPAYNDPALFGEAGGFSM